jgi:2Fe-2S ferredoxin
MGSHLLSITVIDTDGSRHAITARPGQSLMEAVLRTSVKGIEAKCRGNCCCVTCHVYIDPLWAAAFAAPSPMEESMLDFAEDVDARSRLACQVILTEDCHGMIVTVPLQRTIGA